MVPAILVAARLLAHAQYIAQHGTNVEEMRMSMVAGLPSVNTEVGAVGRRLVPWPPVLGEPSAFVTPADPKPAIVPAIVTRAKQALLDDVRKLVLQGVDPRPDGLEISPTAPSLTIAEQLISSLPDDVAIPSVCLPDDGEITFSWQIQDEAGERWRAVLAIAPDSEVECFVRKRGDDKPVAHFRTDDGVATFCLPDNILCALRAHWRT